jgi:hypothetical protein
LTILSIKPSMTLHSIPFHKIERVWSRITATRSTLLRTVHLGVEFEYYFNLLCKLRDLTLWDKIWKNWIKYNLFLKKIVEYYSTFLLFEIILNLVLASGSIMTFLSYCFYTREILHQNFLLYSQMFIDLLNVTVIEK